MSARASVNVVAVSSVVMVAWTIVSFFLSFFFSSFFFVFLSFLLIYRHFSLKDPLPTCIANLKIVLIFIQDVRFVASSLTSMYITDICSSYVLAVGASSAERFQDSRSRLIDRGHLIAWAKVGAICNVFQVCRGKQNKVRLIGGQ